MTSRGRRTVRVEEARILFRAGRAREALSDAEALLRIDPRNPEVLSLAARCHNALEQHDAAIALATRSLSAEVHPEALMIRGDSLRALGRTDEAVADLQKAIALSPATRDLRVALAATFEEAGRAGQARAALAPVLAELRAKQGANAPLPDRIAYEHAKLLVREGTHDSEKLI
jgi:tetratricopeptide (TPR) repeat protein